MKGLILKDIYGIRITQKTYILLFLFLCIFGYIMKSPGYVGVMCIVVFATSINYHLSIWILQKTDQRRFHSRPLYYIFYKQHHYSWSQKKHHKNYPSFFNAQLIYDRNNNCRINGDDYAGRNGTEYLLSHIRIQKRSCYPCDYRCK